MDGFGESWAELTREAVITTIAGQRDYALPQGFAGLITDTAWDRSTYRQAPGPLTPQQYQRLQGGLIDTIALTPRYRLALSEDTNTVRFRLDPVPAGEDDISFEYLSKFWARESEASPISLDRITDDSQRPVFPSHLVELDLEWRVRKSQGLNYRTDIAEFDMERDRQCSASPQRKHPQGRRRSYMTNTESILGSGNIPRRAVLEACSVWHDVIGLDPNVSIDTFPAFGIGSFGSEADSEYIYVKVNGAVGERGEVRCH